MDGEFIVKKKRWNKFSVRNFPILPSMMKTITCSGIIGISSDITQEVKVRITKNSTTLELVNAPNWRGWSSCCDGFHMTTGSAYSLVSILWFIATKIWRPNLDEKGKSVHLFNGSRHGAKRMKDRLFSIMELSRASDNWRKRDVESNEVISELQTLEAR